MRDRYDVVIVGGAVIGSAVAYFLTANSDFDGSVLVIERDPTYLRASTSLSSSSIRNQFSNPVNVRIGQFGTAFIRDFAETMQVGDDRPDLGFHEGGYLFLARTAEQVRTLRENHAVQRECGADVVLWNRDELAEAFPHLRTDDIQLASYGQSGEGWFNNTGMMYGFKAKAREFGAEYMTDEAIAMERDGNRVTSVTLKSGNRVKAGTVVNASGPRAALTARMARRKLLLGLIAVFTLGNLASMLAPSYETLILARFAAGLPHGAFFGVAALSAAHLMGPQNRAKAVAHVMSGLTIATVLGVPMASWLGQSLGWRAAFGLVVGIGRWQEGRADEHV